MKALVEAATATKAATSDLSMIKQIYLLENANGGWPTATSVQCGKVKVHVASACVLMWWSRPRRRRRLVRLVLLRPAVLLTLRPARLSAAY